MSKPDLSHELERMKIQITPGAIEILMNSNVPPAMLVNEIKKRWKMDTSALTVKDAIDLMLSSDKYVQLSQRVHTELKEKVEETSAIPRLLRKTYFTLKRLNRPVSAGQVSRLTHRKTNTEQIYLNNLAKLGTVKKVILRNNKIHYSVFKEKE